MNFQRACFLASLVSVASLSASQVYTSPNITLLGGQSTPFGQVHTSLFASLPQTDSSNGAVLASIGGQTEYYHLSNMSPLTKLFSRTLVPVRTGETFQTFDAIFEGHFSSPTDFPNPADFLIRPRTAFAGQQPQNSLARYANGQIKFIARHGATLDGGTVATVTRVRPCTTGDAAFSVRLQSGGIRLYRYSKSTSGVIRLAESGMVLPGGRAINQTSVFDAAIDPEGKTVFFTVSDVGVPTSVYACRLDGSGKTFVADQTTLVPGTSTPITKLIHALNERVYLEAGSLPANRGIYSLKDSVAQLHLGPGMTQYPGQSNPIGSIQAQASSANGLWQVCLANMGTGPLQVVAVTTPTGSPNFSNIWMGPAVGSTHTDPSSGRVYTILNLFSGANHISNSGQIQFMALIQMQDTGVTTTAILRAYPNLL